MRRTIIPYNPKLKALASKLRKNMTLGEVLLWKRLRNKQMMGYDFDRQRPIDEYIVDFYCKDLMLAIEIDGGSHDHEEVYERDIKRQHRLESLGVSFLRFKEKRVREDMLSVCMAIEGWIAEWEKEHPELAEEIQKRKLKKRK